MRCWEHRRHEMREPPRTMAPFLDFRYFRPVKKELSIRIDLK